MIRIIRMLKITIVCFLLLSNNGYAQQAEKFSVDSMAIREAIGLRQKLSLSTRQQSQIEIAARKFHENIQTEQRQVTDSSRRNKIMRHIYTAYQGEIKKILTIDQYKNYELMIQQRKAAFKEHAQQKGIKVNELD